MVNPTWIARSPLAAGSTIGLGVDVAGGSGVAPQLLLGGHAPVVQEPFCRVARYLHWGLPERLTQLGVVPIRCRRTDCGPRYQDRAQVSWVAASMSIAPGPLGPSPRAL